MENDQTEPKTGRPRSKVPKELLKLRLDPTTLRILEELETYGRLGTTKQDIVMYILRTWLWEHEARLIAGIASKANPLGSSPEETK